ncbi:hypothetical protein EDD21DRAFT_350837 [Dissophora ornata]|nr:hypothetical protein EDD21DRAFT_350837 [Dissophora ornata]
MSSDAPYPDKKGHHSIAVIKEKIKGSSHTRHNDPILLTPQDSVPQRPSARNTPMLSIQPHHTEISTHRPSVSGRLFLHIPKLARKKLHFISLALHLRLKESISWSRQDLVTFEIEKQSWSQTVWDKKIVLSYQDRQVEEGSAPYVAVVKEPSSSKGRIEIEADEWRWEWLMPVTENEVRPESFEGSMGNVWYELEAICLFRWDDVDKDGNVEVSTSSPLAMEVTLDSSTAQGSSRQTGTTLMKGLESSSKKAKSLAQALGKLRVGSKTKKPQHAGDFTLGSQHDEFVERSLRMRNISMTLGKAASENGKALLSASARGQSAPHLGLIVPESTEALSNHTSTEPPPFLIRKILKLYFIKPPPSTSSNKDFFLPPPSMALPTLPGTRRWKAIIPGARIQVQIQIPSLIPIRGYSQTSQLVPDHKKGSLVHNKHSAHNTDNQPHHRLHHNSQGGEVDSTYLDSFQVALTIRKMTQTDINNNSPLKKRHQSAGGANSTSMSANTSDAVCSEAETDRKGMLGASISNSGLSSQYIAGSAERGEAAAGGPGRPWRKEIRVRKVKCEFWQKERCRVPSDAPDTGSRTIKYALGPAFTYSEKDQERERTRSSMQLMPLSVSQMAQHEASQQTNTNASTNANTTSWKIGVSGSGTIAGDQDHHIRKNSNSGGPLSPTMKASNSIPHQQSLSLLQTSAIPYISDRKESDTSPTLQPTSLSTSQASKPFMLLFPVPLDSPHLRQTFTWPSPETPSPLPSSRHDPTSLSARNFSNNDIDFGTPTPRALYRMAMMGTAADNAADEGAYDPSEVLNPESNAVFGGVRSNTLPTTGHHAHNRGHHSRGPVRTRIEVKHYLSIRLSIDMLEFEGELKQDEEVDLEAMEELQLQQVKNRQELSAYRLSSCTFDSTAAYGAAITAGSITSPRALTAIPPSGSDSQERSRYGYGIAGNGMTSSYTPGTSSSMPSMHIADPSSSTMLPALTFLNSTAGLLDLDTYLEDEISSSEDRTHHGNRSRASSSNSLHHQRPSRSNSSSGTALLGSSPQPQPLLGAIYDLNQRRGSGASQGAVKSSTGPNNGSSVPGGLVGGAIGVIKKKTSSPGLKEIANALTKGNVASGSGGQQGQGQSQSSASAIPSSVFQAHRRHRSSAATVQKLKDFVIRVPITVVIQVDDLFSVGTTAMADEGDSVTYTGHTATTDDSNASEGVGMRITMDTTGFGSEFQSTTTVDSMEDNGSMRDEPATTSHQPTMRGEDGQEQKQQLRYLARVGGEGEDSECV